MSLGKDAAAIKDVAAAEGGPLAPARDRWRSPVGPKQPRPKRGPKRGPLVHARDRWRALAIALVCLLVLVLVPMVVISAFDHSYADDWHYGVDAHLALQAGGGLVDALRAAVEEVARTYHSWQGTYSALLLMALQPGVFSEDLYGLGAVAIMGALIAATWYAVTVAVRDGAGGGRSAVAIVAATALLLQTQLVPSPVEAFWWYNAAIYYTFYHALVLVMVALAVRVARGGSWRRPYTPAGVAWRVGALCLLAFVVAGGNFVSGLVAVLALGGVVVLAVLKRSRAALPLALPLVVLVAGFVFSMAAPGNALRQVSQFEGDNLGVIVTLVRSGYAGFEYLLLWTNGLLVLALAALMPLFVHIARASSCSFRLPGVAALAALALFMASFTPTFFSMGTVGPGRVQNIRYDLFVLLVFGCAFWFTGWCVRRLEERGLWDGGAGRPASGKRFRVEPSPDPVAASGPARATVDAAALAASTNATPEQARRRVEPLRVFYVVLGVLLFMGVMALAVDERHRDDLTSVSATASLMTGEAAAYDRQVEERLAYLAESDEPDVEVPFITRAPKVLFMGDIRDNMDNYINFRLSQWFGKDSVVGYHSQLR